ncbi:MAG: hypothetical protein O3A62_02910 [Actinomycetota bacterium]|nr:hypothetical protein [Actinomycetota bacterium]MDA3004006.1 hypothetical protein [Actinomycetota bacterium]
MKDAGFIFGSYIVTLGAISMFAFLTLRRAKKSSQLATDKDKTWL